MNMRQCVRLLCSGVVLLSIAGCPWCPTEPLLKADFQAAPVSGTAPLEVAFTDASTSRGAPVTAWTWNFGDGGSSTEQNPRHTYQRVGKYTVLLQAQSADGFDVRSKRQLIDVTQPTIAPEARFRAEPLQGTAPLRVAFRDRSLPGSHPIDTWAWDFGDGETSNDRHPVHVYADPGTYPVSLTVHTSAGQHTLTKPALIAVAEVEVPVSFASPALETLVREAVQQPDGGLVESQVSGIETLSGQGLGISDLAGLEYCAALETLDLGGNEITDLGPLSSLSHLTWLNLEDNAVSDLAPLLANPAFGSGAMLWLRGNPLGQQALCVQIPALEARGVQVDFDGECAGSNEGELEGEVEGQVEGQLEGEVEVPVMTLRRQVFPGQACGAEAALDLVVTLSYDGAAPVTALGLVETLPDGWTFGSVVSGPAPANVLARPSGEVEFLWIEIPAFPMELRYRILVPVNPSGTETVSGLGLYRLDGPELRTNTETTSFSCGIAPEEGEGEWPGSDRMFLAQTVSGPYTPGMPLDVTVTLDYTDPENAVMAVGLMTLLPPLWSYQGLVSGQLPPIRPNAGAQGDLGFMWIDVPLFPVTFTYRVLAPESASGPQTFSGQILYRLSGPELTSALVQTTVLPADTLDGEPQEGEGAFEGAVEGTLEGSSEGSPEGEPEGITEGEGEGVLAYDMVLERAIAAGYVPGQTLDVTLTLTYTGAGQVSALGARETLPPGWTFVKCVSGDLPPIRPSAGTPAPFGFAWIQVPEFPASFTYRVRAPEDATGPQLIRGHGEYRTVGGPLVSNDTESIVLPGEVNEGEVEGTVEGEGEVALDYDMVLDRVMSGDYLPGQTLDVTLTLTYTGDGPITALGIYEIAPSGWTFVRLNGGKVPTIHPAIRDTSPFPFAWIEIPAFPVRFTYRVRAPEDAEGPQLFRGQGEYRSDGPRLVTNYAETLVLPADTGEGEGTFAFDMVLDRVIAGGYVPGQTLDITLNFAYTGSLSVRAIGLYEFLPDGWTFERLVSGDLPPIRPDMGESTRLGFAWIEPPVFPARFTYRVRAPEDAVGAQVFAGQVEYRTDDPPLISNYAQTIVLPSDVSEGEGESEGTIDGEGGLEYGMVLEREVAGPCVPGETVDVTVILRYAGEKPLSALGLYELSSFGWSFAGLVSGDLPEIIPDIGQFGGFYFAWSSPLAFPTTFTYRLYVPVDQPARTFLSGTAVYRTDGPELTSNYCETELIWEEVPEGECVPIGDYGLLQGAWSNWWEGSRSAFPGVTWIFVRLNCRDVFHLAHFRCYSNCWWNHTDSGWYELDESAHQITLWTMASCDNTYCDTHYESPVVTTLSYEIQGDQLVLGTETLRNVEDEGADVEF
jgi:PKD repeat protein